MEIMDQSSKATASVQRNFAFCYRPIYYFARVCGQMPYTITYHPNGAIVGIKLYKCDFIWFAISLSIQISFIYMAINFYKSYQSYQQQVQPIVSTIYFGQLTIWFICLLFGITVMGLDTCNC